MRLQKAPYLIADVVALLFIAHGNTSFGSLAPIIPYRSCKHYLGSVFIVISLAYYVQFHFGYQSLDMLSMLTAELCHKTYGFGLTVVYLVLTLLALIMGVKPGIGTLLSAVLFGKLVNIAMPAVKSLTKWI